jgi:nucleoside-diphosphate-sugar epimerase
MLKIQTLILSRQNEKNTLFKGYINPFKARADRLTGAGYDYVKGVGAYLYDRDGFSRSSALLDTKHIAFLAHNHVINIDKAKKELGYLPSIFLEEGLGKTFAGLDMLKNN